MVCRHSYGFNNPYKIIFSLFPFMSEKETEDIDLEETDSNDT